MSAPLPAYLRYGLESEVSRTVGLDRGRSQGHANRFEEGG